MLNEHKMEHARGTQQRTAVHMLVAILCFISTVLPSGGLTKISSKCFRKTNFVTLDLACDVGFTIHVLQVIGGRHTDNTCMVSLNTSQCNAVIHSEQIDTPCNGKQVCQHEVLIYKFKKCENVTAAQLTYDCVDNTLDLNMCSDVSLPQNTSNDIIYLKSPGFPNSSANENQCTCIVKIEGGTFRLQILDLFFSYNTDTNEEPSFIVKNTSMTLWDAKKRRSQSCPSLKCSHFTKQSLEITPSQYHVEIVYNNKNQSGQNLWLEIAGYQYDFLIVECNAKISERNRLPLPQPNTALTSTSSPPSVSTVILSPDVRLNSTSSSATSDKGKDKKDTVTIVVVVLVVGLVFVGAVLVGVIIFRRKRTTNKHDMEAKPSPLKDSSSTKCNNNGFDVSGYTEISVDSDGKPDLGKHSTFIATTSLTENNNQPSSVPKEFAEHGEKGNALRSFVPQESDNNATNEHLHVSPYNGSIHSEKSDHELDATTFDAVLRNDNSKNASQEKDQGVIEKPKPLANQIEKIASAESGGRDSVPYITPADSIRACRPDADVPPAVCQADDDDPYSLPADALQISARKTYPTCVLYI